MSGVAAIEEEKKAYREQVRNNVCHLRIRDKRWLTQTQLDIVAAQIRDDPGNAELKALQEELNSVIDLLNENIAELQPKQAPKPAAKEPSPPAEPEKWSRESHPAFKKAAPPPPPPQDDKEEALVNYRVNDTVMAKWVTGDRGFYPAKITSVTGSSTAPIYTVKFKSYDTTETLRSRDIKPVSNKRKADDPAPPPGPSTASAPAPGVVSSAGATMYPDAQKEAQKDEEAAKAPKPKKIKAKKELEAGKASWQAFNSKSKSKSSKKDSMFRTPEGIHGRGKYQTVPQLLRYTALPANYCCTVGFTGSGQAMRKDPTRSRHVYQVNDDLD